MISRCISILIAALGFSLGFSVAHGAPARLGIEIIPQFAGQPIQPNSLRYQNAAGEDFSITRVSYLLSGFALERADGSWQELTNAIAWLDLERNRNTIEIIEAPRGTYRGLRFHVGLDPEMNHAKPEQFPAEHPLNPNFNGLHWSWQGGYIFLAVEGMWRGKAGPYDGWSYHFARDTNRTRINLATPLQLAEDARVELAFDLASLLNIPRPLSFAKDGSSTHSREGDPIAAALAANLPGAFHVRRVTTMTSSQTAAVRVKPLYMPPRFTPYMFQMSATFPIPDLPRDNPLIKERVELGERLFHEKALSRDNSISCASCHQSDSAFADPRRYSLGVRNQEGTRNAMPLFNLAWKTSFFWDGRAPSLRTQALFPIQDHVEMDESLTNLVVKLQNLHASRRTEHEHEDDDEDVLKGPPRLTENPGPIRESSAAGGDRKPAGTNGINYPALFIAAFGSPEITAEKIGLAIEQFVLTLMSFDSRFDRAMKGEGKLSEEEKRGFELFITENDPRRGQYGADCFHCHGGPLFQSQTFANNGLDATFSDPGRAKITGKDADAGKFATPSLRNVALTSPYMHDGRFKTLEEVVEHYSTGMKRSPTLDPNLAKHPDGGLGLSAADKRALVAFLRTLTDERYLVLP